MESRAAGLRKRFHDFARHHDGPTRRDPPHPARRAERVRCYQAARDHPTQRLPGHPQRSRRHRGRPSALAASLGPHQVFTLPQPLSGSEDFGIFGTALEVPSVLWQFGGTDPAAFSDADFASLRENGVQHGIPGNHSSRFAPVFGAGSFIGRWLLLELLGQGRTVAVAVRGGGPG